MFGLALDEKIKKQLYLRFTERSDTMKSGSLQSLLLSLLAEYMGRMFIIKRWERKFQKESKFVEIAKEKQSLQR